MSIHMSNRLSTAVRGSDLSQGLARAEPRRGWELATFSGRFSEFSGAESSAALTFAVGLIGEAQRCGEPVAWLGRRASGFYPPDVAARGVDLSALAVIWTSGALESARAADLLLRSGAFGLILMDLGTEHELPLAVQNRLAVLAKKHGTALIGLTHKEAQQPSMGSLISLRAQVTHGGRDHRGFWCEARILKDKRAGPGWRQSEVYHGPDGLRGPAGLSAPAPAATAPGLA